MGEPIYGLACPLGFCFSHLAMKPQSMEEPPRVGTGLEGNKILTCPCSHRKCVSECPLGYFGDAAARRCRRCHKGCETCTGRSPAQCLSCRRGFYHHQETNACVTLCPAGLYADESKWTVHRHKHRWVGSPSGPCSPV